MDSAKGRQSATHAGGRGCQPGASIRIIYALIITALEPVRIVRCSSKFTHGMGESQIAVGPWFQWIARPAPGSMVATGDSWPIPSRARGDQVNQATTGTSVDCRWCRRWSLSSSCSRCWPPASRRTNTATSTSGAGRSKRLSESTNGPEKPRSTARPTGARDQHRHKAHQCQSHQCRSFP